MNFQYPLPLNLNQPHRESMTAEDFMVAASNREAAQWVLEREPSTWASHALILYGPPACGKTHLLKAWCDTRNATAFTCGDDRLESLVTNQITPPAIALDNADTIIGDPTLEEWLQHLYNATRATNTPLLLTAQKPPAAWDLALKDIASRLNSCPAIAISEPDDDLMRGLLMKQFSDRQLLVEDGVIEYLARRLERTGSAIRTTVALLDQQSLQSRHKISIPFAQQILDKTNELPE